MKTKNNNLYMLKACTDTLANMLEVMPGDILIIRPRPSNTKDE